MTRNLLGSETSPYLLQHKDNPVHWQSWSGAALARAQAEDKPILLSIGYAACHWCHVMAHESFENPETAQLMNELYVNIKIDREERPDLDAIYQSALALLGEQGGWPLTMFLTPEGAPFWGGTYFPPEPRYGRPAFRDVLAHIAKIYRQSPDRIRENVDAISAALAKLSQPAAGESIPIAVIDRIAEHLLNQVDRVEGGLGGAPKFPHLPLFELLWRAWRRTGQKNFREAVILSLDRMSEGGLYDHLGGGYARYSTDTHWLVPHFEKMLYDNAQFLDLLTLVWQETKAPLYRQRVAETVDWLVREMLTPDGGFAATLDADSEGEEGKFYVWTEAEIDALLGADAAAFKNAYDVAPGGNWEHRNILNRSRRFFGPGPAPEYDETALARARAILLAARGRRIRPALDDKVLADWNGLTIAALANAGAVFDRPDWIAHARRAFDFVVAHMTDRAKGADRLGHSWRGGRLDHPATADDYANMSRAALALHEATGEGAYLERARAWVDALDRHYWDKGGGGYFFTADDTPDLVLRTKTASDAAVPSANGTMVGVLVRLFHLTGEAEFEARARAIVTAFSGELQRNFIPLATLINNAEFAERADQIVIIGARSNPDCRALIAAVYEHSLPNRLLGVIPPGRVLPDRHPAAGKGQVDGKATAYVCRGRVCSLPAADAPTLARLLDLQ